MDTNYYNYESSYTATSSADPALAGVALVFFGIMMLLYVAIIVVVLASYWKLFEKAGKPGWAGIVPIYNMVVMLDIAGRPLWWVALLFIPIVNFVVAVIVMYEFVRSYGKDTAYAVITILIPVVMFPVMAFSKSTKYHGPYGPEKANQTPAAKAS